MSYYCLKKTSAKIERLTTLGTENDLLDSKSFDRERIFDSYIYTSYIKASRVMGIKKHNTKECDRVSMTSVGSLV